MTEKQIYNMYLISLSILKKNQKKTKKKFNK